MTALVTSLAMLTLAGVAVGADAEKADEPARPRARQMDQLAEKPADGGRAGRRQPVTLGIVRRGKPQQVEAVLAARRPGDPRAGDAAAAVDPRPMMPGMQPNVGELLAQALAMAQPGGVGGSSVQVQSSTVNGVVESQATARDGEGTVEIASRGGRKTVAILGPDGDEIHAGPLDGPNDLEAVPEEWRERVEQLDARISGLPVPRGGL